jgi:hypothetical protein
MPIEFPLPPRGNPFDRWLWQRNGKCPQQQPNPNLSRIGVPFTSSTFDPGIGSNVRVPVNVRNLGKFYKHGNTSAAVVNPASGLKDSKSINDGNNDRVFLRELGTSNSILSGVSRDNFGVALGFCRVMAFRTNDMSFVGETTSDGSGNWTMPMQKSGLFFLVEYKSGSPDVAGTSVNTINTSVV